MKLKGLVILTFIGLLAITGYAEVREHYDACDGVALYMVWNDTTGLDPTSYIPPQGGTDVSGCPDDLYLTTDPALPETLQQLFFPDTLLFPNKVLDELAAEGKLITEVSKDYSWYPGMSDDMIENPPIPMTDCCEEGVYAKARMFDNATGTYSPWTDVNTTDMFIISYVPGYGTVLQVSMMNFKVRNLSNLMGFDCNVDTLFLYVWDCNDGDVAGTFGEFGVVYRVFPDGTSISDLSANQVYMHKYGPDINVDEKPSLPQAYALEQNQPNPFNSATQIAYALPEDATVKIEITNILGNKVRTLVDGHESAGYRRVLWNGLDDSGKEVPSGVYFYTIRANDFTARNRAILMK